ncbi:regulatory protein RecX [Granulosicoccaceae sp. 1_MG-2023]|nr:regulatory protein RecX [Granulosicoccaceae sp. 1_MG-2023]
MLSRREHTRRELYDKLFRRGFDGDVIEGVIAALEESQLQSDYRFAELYAEQRAAKGYGAQRIRAELRDRGVSGEVCDEAMAVLETDWVANAARMIARKFGAETALSGQELLKCKRYLHGRGFSSGQIRAALSAHAGAHEDL